MSWMMLGWMLALQNPVETGQVEFRPALSEADTPEAFRLEHTTFAFELQQTRETPRYTVSEVRFPSPIVTPDLLNNTVHAELFCPRSPGKHPGVVVLHILGADFALSRYMASRLADRGVAALFVKLPYYGERRDPEARQRFLSTDIARSVTAMRQGVCDVRRAAVWLASRPEIDAGKIGITGISLGGIVGALSAAVDPVFKRSALLLAGGGLGEILWTMPEAEPYRRLWLASGKTRDDLIALTKPYDPLTFAKRLRGRNVLMMAGRVDEVVPPSATIALWKEAGQPDLIWFDCGHYSAAGYLLPAIRMTVDYFAEDVDAPAPPCRAQK